MQTLGSRPTMPKNLPGHWKERKNASKQESKQKHIKEYGGVELDESRHSFTLGDSTSQASTKVDHV